MRQDGKAVVLNVKDVRVGSGGGGGSINIVYLVVIPYGGSAFACCAIYETPDIALLIILFIPCKQVPAKGKANR